MTGVAAVLPARLDPSAPHPPFGWSIDLPADWALLDTAPPSWRRSAERLVDDRFDGDRLSRPERRGVLDVIEALVGDCQRAGTVLSVLQLGRLASGGVGSAGLQLAWYDSAPEPAGLAAARRAVPHRGTAVEVPAATGPALLHEDRMSVVAPGTAQRVALTTHQVFVPVHPTTWTAVLSTASAHPELTGTLRELVLTVAASIDLVDPATADPVDDGAQVGGPTAGETWPVGFSRGFTTRLHRHEVPGQASDDEHSEGDDV